ncbi:MAG: hypothetical protein HQL56_15765, partial [Magnetococcales bacterium]|nr:hypothetical protein [Magnetococcales bacterium]
MAQGDNERTLEMRRESIRDSKDAYEYELMDSNIKRLCKTLRIHLEKCGYKISPKRDHNILINIIRSLFEAQDRKPMFHIEGTPLPLCWNSPAKGGWDLTYIKYEWGHLKSINQNPNLAYH